MWVVLMQKTIKAFGAASLLFVAGSAMAASDTCGKVTIADMNWSSATLIANIDHFILNNGYDCKAELVPGDTMPTGISMVEKGEPDIAPEIGLNSLKELLEKGVAEKRIRFAGMSLAEGQEQGFCVCVRVVLRVLQLRISIPSLRQGVHHAGGPPALYGHRI